VVVYTSFSLWLGWAGQAWVWWHGKQDGGTT
jgi:hypothetical protein